MTNVTAQYLGASQVTGGYNSGTNSGYITLSAAGLIQSGSYALTLSTPSSYPGSNNINILPGTGGNVVLQGNILSAGNTHYSGSFVATGNVVSPNYLYPNGVSILTGIGGTYSNSNVASYLPVYSGYINAAGVTTGQVSGSTGLYLQTAGTYNWYFDSTGNLNLPSGGMIKFANGVNILSAIAPSSTYSNANVTAYLAAGTDPTIYSNTNVAAYLTTTTVPFTNNVSLTTVTNSQGYYVTFGNVTTGNTCLLYTSDAADE